MVALPPDYDPMAETAPYEGPHPATVGRPRDPYDYPIPLGQPGPAEPVFGPPNEYPYACRTEASGLGQPLVDNRDGIGTPVYAPGRDGGKTRHVAGYSKDCGLPTTVRYLYLPGGAGELQPWREGAADVARIEIDGEPVPFRVRVETGTINRHIYVIAMLAGPGDRPERPDTAYWNGRLVYQLRGGVGIGHRQGRVEPGYIPARRRAELARGYAVAYSTANQTSNSYDIWLAEDTLARVKRQFVARYGEPLYTVGIGGSGGAIQQYLIGQNRPGLLDAGIALYSYPDMVTQTIHVLDCELLEHYFDVIDADNPKWHRWSQRRWIEGLNASDEVGNVYQYLRGLAALARGELHTWERGNTECVKSWRLLAPQIINPHYNYFASLFAEDVADSVPWTYFDDLKHVYGTDRHGYGRRTWDNVGVQYGLAALTEGRITPEEFLRLNAAIGGWKPAHQMQPERLWRYPGAESGLDELSLMSAHNQRYTDGREAPARRSEADPAAVAAAYRSGQVFLGRLEMPVIDYRHYLEPSLNMHHSLQSFAARLRLQKGQGHADNQLVWMSPPGHTAFRAAFDLVDEWLANRRERPGAGAAETRPERATDRCYDDRGKLIAEGPTVWNGVWNGKPDGACMQAYPIYATSRIVAGADYAGDVFKCHLQSVDEALARGLYAPADMTPHARRLREIFPDGVCDYARGDAARPADMHAAPDVSTAVGRFTRNKTDER